MAKPLLDFSHLSPEQRLELIEELWDSLNDDPSQVPLTQAHREELDRRLDEIEEGDDAGIPWDEVLSRIRKRLA